MIPAIIPLAVEHQQWLLRIGSLWIPLAVEHQQWLLRIGSVWLGCKKGRSMLPHAWGSQGSGLVRSLLHGILSRTIFAIVLCILKGMQHARRWFASHLSGIPHAPTFRFLESSLAWFKSNVCVTLNMQLLFFDQLLGYADQIGYIGAKDMLYSSSKLSFKGFKWEKQQSQITIANWLRQISTILSSLCLALVWFSD